MNLIRDLPKYLTRRNVLMAIGIAISMATHVVDFLDGGIDILKYASNVISGGG